MTMVAVPCDACQHWNMPGAQFCEACGNTLAQGQYPYGPPRVISIGRDPSNDYVVPKTTVSSRHAQLEVTADGRLLVRDLGSVNRTFINTPVEPVTTAQVLPSDILFLGRMPIPVYEILARQQQEKMSVRKTEAVAVQMKTPRVVFGRDPQCDYPLSHPMVSWRQAVLYRTNDNRFFIEDLQSRNGTYVNGKRILPGKRVELRIASDEISFGSYSFRLSGVGTIEARETGREIRVMAKGIAVAVPNEAGGTKMILEKASLAIEPGDLVALMGPSGAGKTTLLCALNGLVTPVAGQVLYQRGTAAPVELRRHYEQIRPLIGYVPQDDIMHPQLTVFEALYYTAKLRLPGDYDDAQIHRRIQTVLSDIGLWEEYDPERPGRRLLQHTIIGDAVRRGISGGQRKRVNFAMELLSEPALLFLDEPTSGLSSIDARQVVSTLRKLTEGGCTIIVTIHQPSMEVYQLFTLLALVSNHPRTKNANKETGKLVYFGPAKTAFDFFGCHGGRNGSGASSPEDIETALLSQPVDHWFEKYQTFGGLADHYGSKLDGSKKTGAAELPPVKREHLSQIRILTQRYFKLKWRDHTQMALALGLPIVFGALVAASQRMQEAVAVGSTIDDLDKWTQFIRKVGTMQFLMVVAAFWFGCNNAIRELVGERAIYRRERMVNLSIFAYLSSKYVVLGGLALAQCAIMLLFPYLLADVRADYPALLLTLWITALTGTGLGTCLSAALPTTEAAIASLPLVLLPMIVLGGGMTTLADMDREQKHVLRAVSDVLVPTRWAYEANMLEETRAQKVHGTTAEIYARKEVERQLANAPAAAPGASAAGQGQPAPDGGAAKSEPAPEPPDVAALAFPTVFHSGEGSTKQKHTYVRHSYWDALGRLGIFAGILAILGALILKLDEVPAWKGLLSRAGHTWRELGPGMQVVVLALIVAALVVVSFMT